MGKVRASARYLCLACGHAINDAEKFAAASELITSFHLTNYRKCHGSLKTSRPVWGWVKKIDKVARQIA